MKNILVLCVGNICRSPMAEAILAAQLPNCVVRSAGMGAMIGKPADPTAVKLAAEAGYDITGHRAQQLSAAHLSWADLVLVMEREHKNSIEETYMSTRGKVFLLGETTGGDIADPYLKGVQSFQSALMAIQQGVQFWAQRISHFG